MIYKDKLMENKINLKKFTQPLLKILKQIHHQNHLLSVYKFFGLETA